MKALRVIVQTLQPALADDHELLTFLSHRAYALGIPLAQLKGRNRDQLINLILKPAPSKGDYWTEVLAIVQTVAILGEGIKISRELAQAAQKVVPK